VAAERGLWNLAGNQINVVTLRDGAWVACPEWTSYRADPPFRLLRREDIVYKD
jgi:hypothetical protein